MEMLKTKGSEDQENGRKPEVLKGPLDECREDHITKENMMSSSSISVKLPRVVT